MRASSHQAVCYEMPSECHEMFCIRIDILRASEAPIEKIFVFNLMVYSIVRSCSIKDCFLCLPAVQADSRSSRPNSTRMNRPISKVGN